jgi:hypothetical protein
MSADVLDLSGADLKGFDAIPSGSYDAIIFEVGEVETENPDGNLPVGTKGLNVQFKLDGGEYDNRRLFSRYWFPPADYDKTKRDKMLGMFARFLMAVGYSEKEVTGGKFKLDHDDLVGRECKISVNRYMYDDVWRNKVTGVRPRGKSAEESGLL